MPVCSLLLGSTEELLRGWISKWLNSLIAAESACSCGTCSALRSKKTFPSPAIPYLMERQVLFWVLQLWHCPGTTGGLCTCKVNNWVPLIRAKFCTFAFKHRAGRGCGCFPASLEIDCLYIRDYCKVQTRPFLFGEKMRKYKRWLWVMFIDLLCNSKAVQKLENAQGHQKVPVPCGFRVSPTCEWSAQGWGTSWPQPCPD